MRSIFCHQHIFAGATQVDSWVALKNLFLGRFVAECGTHDLLPYAHKIHRSDAEVCCFSKELQRSQDAMAESLRESKGSVNATQLMIG